MIKKISICAALFFCLSALRSQVPFAIWDFESNTNRSTVDLNVESLITGVGSPGVIVSGLTAAHGSGNGLAYSGTVAGSAAGYFGWATTPVSGSGNPSLTFGPFTATGFANISVKFDAITIGALAPTNVDLYYSLNNTGYTKVVGANAVNSSGWTNLNFVLPAGVNGPSTLYLRLVGYNAGAGASATNGVLKIDNLTVSSSTINTAKTLMSSVIHGTALSSGGTYVPNYGDLNLGANLTLASDMTFAGIIALNASNLSIGDNHLTMHSSATPITRSNGRLVVGTNASLTFGKNGFTGGAAYTLPSNLFMGGSSVSIKAFTVNRDNPLTLGNQSLTLSGDLTITKGTLDLNGKNIKTFGNLSGSGTVTNITASVSMDAAGKSIGPLTVSNLTLNAAGNFTMTGDLTITNTLSLNAGSVLVAGNNSLTFHSGNNPVTGTGKINMSSNASLYFGKAGLTAGSAFVIPNNIFSSSPLLLKNFGINRLNPLTLNNQNIELSGVLSIAAGNLTLPSNYVFTLRSTSVTNTAMVDKVGGSITYNTGALFIVERFIPHNLPTSKRSFRDLAPGVTTTTTIFQNWQENGTNTNGYGTHITGAAGSPGISPTTGFDNTQTGNKSMRTYEVQPVGSPIWTNASSTNQVNDVLLGFKGYRVFIRGNRQTNLYNPGITYSMNAPVTLRAKGQLITGTVNVTETGTSINGGPADARVKMNKLANGFTMIANPYAAPISWLTLKAANPSVLNYYLIVDPNMGTPSKPGAYVSYSTLVGSNNISSAMNEFIQPGQAFFVKNGATGPFSFKLTEADKAVSATNLSSVWKTSANAKTAQTLSRVSLTLSTNEAGLPFTLDGASIVFDPDFTSSMSDADVPKTTNTYENFAVKKQSSFLNVATAPLPTPTDSFKIKIWQTETNTTYFFNVNTTQFTQNNVLCFVKDRFTNTEYPVAPNSITTFSFTATADTVSYMERFKLFFRNAVVLPVKFITAEATRQGKNVSVTWSVNQTETAFYHVMRSTNGKDFFRVDSVPATEKNIETYVSHDVNVNAEKLYYRIIAFSKNGQQDLSKVIAVKNELDDDALSIYPNPAENGIINLRIQKLSKGSYQLQLFNIEGKQSAEMNIVYDGQKNIVWELPAHIESGVYLLQISGAETRKTFPCIIR